MNRSEAPPDANVAGTIAENQANENAPVNNESEPKPFGGIDMLRVPASENSNRARLFGGGSGLAILLFKSNFVRASSAAPMVLSASLSLI
jgi:hypothetical protein